MNNALAGLFTDAAQVAPHALDTIVTLLGNSIAVGAVLAVTTYLVARVSRLPFGKKPDGVDESAIEYRLQQFVGSATLLLLCVGLTSLMLVINNSIVRAFALMAAVSLVRFRVRLDRKDASGASLMSAAMLFAVLIGVQQSNYSAQEKGTRPMSDKMINKYCEQLGANAAWVKSGEGVGYNDPKLQTMINEAVEADHVMVNNSTVNVAILTAIITEVEGYAQEKSYTPQKKAILIGGIYEEIGNMVLPEEDQLKLVPKVTATFLKMMDRLG